MEDSWECKALHRLNPLGDDHAAAIADNVDAASSVDVAAAANSTKTNNFQCKMACKELKALVALSFALNPIS